MKKFSSILLALLFTTSLFALEVNTAELRSLSDRAEIEFINYEGPHAVINTAGQIKGIGSSIGKDIAMDEIVKQYDACFVAIGAHIDKKLGIEGEDKAVIYI